MALTGDFERLDDLAAAYQEKSRSIPRGSDIKDLMRDRRRVLLRELGGNASDWNDWCWQIRNRIKDAELVARILSISPARMANIEKVGQVWRWGVTPYYLSLIGEDEELSPAARMVLPRMAELEHPEWGKMDPMNEEGSSPCPAVTRRYPDRLALKVTNRCAAFCRFCQRRRLIGRVDRITPMKVLEGALDYVRRHKGIRDVLITGGDPLTLNSRRLAYILAELKKCPHLDYIRIGTRVLATLPQRITPGLCNLLRHYRPLYVVTHFNHPIELTPMAVRAAERLAEAGIGLLNQTVLLHGVNDDPAVLRCLNHELLKAGIRPYYLFHPKMVAGTRHFYVPIASGLDMMLQLRGYTSGLAIPAYIINAPGGLGKIPLLPDYHDVRENGIHTLKSWQGVDLDYTDFPSLSGFPD